MAENGRAYIRDGRAPLPSSEATSRVMSRNRAKDTWPELALRRELWSRGIRGYRLHMKGVAGRADIAFPRARVAVFVHGCFWHACPQHSRPPKSNAPFWRAKFARNRARDAETLEALERAGWTPVVIWEHEVRASVAEGADRVAAALANARSR